MATLVLVAGYFAVHLSLGQVLYPNRGTAEVGLAPRPLDAEALWNKDTVTLYVPETAAHLDHASSGWLATWTPHSGLGRPLFQFGPAPTWAAPSALALATDDPLVHHTWLTALSVLGTALFAHLFLGVIGAAALGRFVGAVGISLGPLYSSWAMIPLVQWGYCWTFGALLAVEHWLARGSRTSWFAAAFCFHAVLLAGFLQHVSSLALVGAGWTLLRVMVPPRGRPLARGRAGSLFGIVLAAALALVAIAPVYVDLFGEWARSTRATEPQLFEPGANPMKAWPHIFAAHHAGVPGLIGLSFGAAYFTLACLGLTSRRVAWTPFWGLAAVFFALATDVPAAHGLLRRVGVHASNWPPVLAAHLPASILAAAGADAVVRAGSGPSRALLRAVALAALLAGGAALALDAGAPGPALSPLLLSFTAVTGGAVLLSTLVRSAQLRRALLAAVTVTCALVTTHVSVAWSPLDEVARTSPLVDALRERTRDGSRWIWVGPRPAGRRCLEPNIDAFVGTRGLGAYDHLPSTAFHRWSKPLRAPRQQQRPYIRRFDELHDPALIADPRLAFAGVRTLVSTDALRTAMEDAGATFLGEPTPGVLLWAPPQDAPPEALVPLPAERGRLHVAALADSAPSLRADRTLDDVLRFDFEPRTAPSLLFVSQEFHHDWNARSAGAELETLPINGLFQGVVVPAGTASVELRFEPYAPLMLYVQIVFALLAVVAGARALVRTLRRDRGAAPMAGASAP